MDVVKAKGRRARLREIYADGFTHTHGSGKVDSKDTRIVAVLAGDRSIEVAPADELSIRAFGTDTAIVTGRSPILNVRENDAACGEALSAGPRRFRSWSSPARQSLSHLREPKLLLATFLYSRYGRS